MSLDAISLGPHAGFIIAAYLIAAVVIAALIAWVVLDYRAQKTTLADLDARGSTRGRRGPTGAAQAGPA
jgi:heme exporter protein D